MIKKFKPSKKHLSIFAHLGKYQYYKPTYSDREPATMTLLKNGIIEWREDFRGLKLTAYGKQFIEQFKTDNENI